ncbi:MAG: hypothetical protein WCW25_02445 [Patescibacteria group bacterium]|jgi:hypothetical protein
MGKSIDGIKKLNPSEAPRSAERRGINFFDRERSRKLVLETIGEREPLPGGSVQGGEKEKKFPFPALFSSRARIFDGIVKAKSGDGRIISAPGGSKKDDFSKDKEKIDKLLREKQEEEEKIRREEKRREEKKAELKKEALRLEAGKIRAEEVRKIKEADQKRREEEEKKIRLRLEEELRRREVEKKGKERLARVIEEEKKEKARRIREERKRKKKLEEIKIKRQEAAIKIVGAIKRGGKNFSKGSRIFIKYSWLPALVFIVAYLVSYLAFGAALLVFQIDNPNMRKAGKYFPPVPAIFTREWAVDYFFYADARKENKLAAEDMGGYFIKKSVLDELAYRHAYNSSAAEESNRDDFFSRAVIGDEEINKIPLARIRKISELAGENDFYAIGAKYADKSGAARLADLGLQYNGFGEITRTREISPVVFGKDGYYILKFSGLDEKKAVRVDYVFIKAKTLDEYLAEKKESLKVFKLVRD